MHPYPAVVTAPGPVGPAFAPPPEERELRFEFTGNAKEYFRIWIVNTLLTIVTLGIYSAWAKVRTKQYFYRHTFVEGTSFEYLADPLKVLKGRLIAAGALGLLFASQHYSLPLYFGVVGLFVLATPWVLVKALAFNARNSAFRGIRFAFTGRTGEAFGLYLGMLLLYVVSCGTAYPYMQWRMTSFIVTRHLFGDLRLWWESKAGAYYVVYLVALAMMVPAYVILFAVGFRSVGHERDPAAMQRAMLPVFALVYPALLVCTAYVRARVANLVYGGIRLGPHWLTCHQRARDLLLLYVVNFMAVVVSLGLLIPWAKVRLARYHASCLTLHAVGPLHAEKLLDDETTALGEGLSDLGDFDIGIGV
jgi:uncharacterized membrane protein YjgN (DUF898 family)